MCWDLKFPSMSCVPDWTAITCICESIIYDLKIYIALADNMKVVFVCSIQYFVNTKQ